MAYHITYLVVQEPWNGEAGTFLKSFLPEAHEEQTLTVANYTHSDTVRRFYSPMSLCDAPYAGDTFSQLDSLLAGAGGVPSLKYYVADTSGNCLYTNGDHTIGAALSWTSVKADIDANDAIVEKTVYTVTTTEDGVVGSFRAALEAEQAGVKRIVFDIDTPGYFDVDTETYDSFHRVGGCWIEGGMGSFPVIFRKLNPASSGAIFEFFDDDPFYMEQVSIAPGCNVADTGESIQFYAGAGNITLAYLTLRHSNSNQMGFYVGEDGDPIENVYMHHIFVRDPIYAGDGTGCNMTGWYGGSEGEPDVPEANRKYDFRKIRNVVFDHWLWANPSHRDPLISCADPAHPELGGVIVVNTLVYQPGWFGAGVGLEGLADFRSCLFLLPDNATPINACVQVQRNIPPTQWVGAPSIYLNNCKAVRLTTGQTAWNWDIARHADYTNYYVNGSIVMSSVPDALKRATPLDPPFAFDEETDLDALYADLVTNRNVGQYLPYRVQSDEDVFGIIEAEEVIPHLTNASQIEWDVLT